MPVNSTGCGPCATRHGPGSAPRRARHPWTNFKEVAWLVVLDLRLAAGGSPHASGGKRLTVGTEDRRAQGRMRALAFFAPIPLPTPRLPLPLVHTQSKGKAVLEPIAPHDLRPLLPDRLLGAGPLALHGLRDGGVQLEQGRVGRALQQGQRPPRAARKAGAEAHQPVPQYPPSRWWGWPYPLSLRPSGRGRG